MIRGSGTARCYTGQTMSGSTGASPPVPIQRTRLFIACDFDGTVTERDTLGMVVHRYAPHVWESVDDRLRGGQITLLEAMREEFRQVRASEGEVVEFILANARLREGFQEFVRWVEVGRHELVIVSAGFRTLIDPVLAAAGLSHLHVHAGDALFTPRGTSLSFPPSTADCIDACGHCKRETIAAHRPFPGPFVYIGDGYSDRCAILDADIIFARGELARFLEEENVAHHVFDTFRDVIRELESLGYSGTDPRCSPRRGGVPAVEPPG